MTDSTNSKKPSCGTCHFWECCTADTHPQVLDVNSGRLGECCVNPPQIVEALAQRVIPTPTFGSGMDDYYELVCAETLIRATVFPITDEVQRCGRWQAVDRGADLTGKVEAPLPPA